MSVIRTTLATWASETADFTAANDYFADTIGSRYEHSAKSRITLYVTGLNGTNVRLNVVLYRRPVNDGANPQKIYSWILDNSSILGEYTLVLDMLPSELSYTTSITADSGSPTYTGALVCERL